MNAAPLDHTGLSERLRRVHELREQSLSQRRADTQNKLVEAGRIIIAERGVGGASVGLITAKAGFTRGAFYSNFTDMDHFVRTVADFEWATILNAVHASLNANNALPTLRESGTPVGPEEVLSFTRMLLNSIPRDRETVLLWSSLANFMLRSPTESQAIRESFFNFRVAIADIIEDVLAALNQRSRISALDFTDLLLGIGLRSSRDAYINPESADLGNGELIDRVIAHIVPALLKPAPQ